MAQLRDLISRDGVDEATDGIGASSWYATVLSPLPANLTDDLYVRIPDVSFVNDVKWGPIPSARWKRLGTVPTLNQEVLVVFDNRQQPWVIA